jgi:hypothetical protein
VERAVGGDCAASTDCQVLEIDQLLDRCERDESLLSDVLIAFSTQGQERAISLENALQRGDFMQAFYDTASNSAQIFGFILFFN